MQLMRHADLSASAPLKIIPMLDLHERFAPLIKFRTIHENYRENVWINKKNNDMNLRLVMMIW